jgi:hypothetical protein
VVHEHRALLDLRVRVLHHEIWSRVVDEIPS